MQRNEFELVVSPGRQPILYLALAAIFFTSVLFFLYEAATVYYQHGFTVGSTGFALYSTEKIVACIVLGIRFSMIKDVLIDTDTSLLISRYRVGPFSRDIHSKCPNLEYIAVFKNSSYSNAVFIKEMRKNPFKPDGFINQ